MTKLLCAGLLVASALLAWPRLDAAADEPAKAPDKACFYTSQIDGWNYLDDHTVRLSVGPSRQFDVTIMGTAPWLASHEDIGIRSDPTNLICTGNGLGVEVFQGGPFRQRWAVTQIALVPKAKSPSDQPKLQ
jgi:hypothetical protein